jgi:hypothetical protein
MNDRNDTNLAELSPTGQQRREQILAQAVREAGIIRRRRAARRAVGAVMVLSVAAGAGWLIAAHHDGRGAQPPAAAVQAHLPAPPVEDPKHVAVAAVTPPQPRPQPAVVPKQASPLIVIDRIPTDGTLAQQLALPREAKVKLERLSDDALLRTLADAGRPACLTYVAGRASVRYRQGAR